jgi:hypothetical protein
MMEEYVKMYIDDFEKTPKFGITQVHDGKGYLICDPIQYDSSFFIRLVGRYGGTTGGIPSETPTTAIDCGSVHIVPGVIIVEEDPNDPAYISVLTEWEMTTERMFRKVQWVLKPEETPAPDPDDREVPQE